MYFFTSDTHYGHRSILTYTARPYASVDEMDAVFVDNWNKTVLPSDIVWHLGDFALCHPRHTVEIAKSLKGHKHIVWGNHDKATRKDKDFLACWESHHDLVTVKVPDQDHPHKIQLIVACHYALRIWDRSHHGAWHLYGHSHGSLPDDPHSYSLDIGVDAWTETWKTANHETREIETITGPRYRPVSYEQIKARMATKIWRPVDGHRGDRE